MSSNKDETAIEFANIYKERDEKYRKRLKISRIVTLTILGFMLLDIIYILYLIQNLD